MTTSKELLSNDSLGQLIVVTKRDGTEKAVRSPYSDHEAQKRLVEITSSSTRSGFAESLVTQMTQERPLSRKQMDWVHVLVVEHASRSAKTKQLLRRARVALWEREPLSGIRAMMDRAAETLRSPRVSIDLPSGDHLRFSRAGDRSKRPGVINVTDGKPFGENVWYGRIELDGSFCASAALTDEVADAMRAFDQDPTAVATAYGQRTSRCCFCGRDLTTAESVAVGFGPVCAEKYGLEWGVERAPSKITLTVGG